MTTVSRPQAGSGTLDRGLRGCAAVKLLEGVHTQLVSRSVVAFLLKLLKPCSRRVDGLASRVVVSRLKRELL